MKKTVGGRLAVLAAFLLAFAICFVSASFVVQAEELDADEVRIELQSELQESDEGSEMEEPEEEEPEEEESEEEKSEEEKSEEEEPEEEGLGEEEPEEGTEGDNPEEFKVDSTEGIMPGEEEIPDDKICSDVVSDVEEGEVTVGTKVTLSCDTENSSIFFNTTGAEEYLPYSEPIEITEDIVIFAFSEAEGYYSSNIVTFKYSIIPHKNTNAIPNNNQLIIPPFFYEGSNESEFDNSIIDTIADVFSESDVSDEHAEIEKTENTTWEVKVSNEMVVASSDEAEDEMVTIEEQETALADTPYSLDEAETEITEIQHDECVTIEEAEVAKAGILGNNYWIWVYICMVIAFALTFIVKYISNANWEE